ncbi:MAG TPA: hypothetical protein VFT72_06920 [Opitutaceae bacterium]|nr:hypothetical protein [Opitutaceae bacterium]
MNTAQELEMPERSGAGALWWGWILAPTWWLTQFEIRYALVHWSCARDHRGLVAGTGAAALVVAILIALWTWRYRASCRGEQPRTFVATGAVWTSVAFALLVAAQLLPDVFIDLCRR